MHGNPIRRRPNCGLCGPAALGFLLLAGVSVWAVVPPSKKPTPAQPEKGKSVTKTEEPQVIMTLEKYQGLLHQIEGLKTQLEALKAPAKPVPPQVCKLTAKVDGEVVHLHAEFEFRTERNAQLVALGCPQTNPLPGATLDDHLPALQYGEDGFVVFVDKAGDHKLVVDLDVPLGGRATKESERLGGKNAGDNERGFNLDLPRAAVTTLELHDLHEAVTEVRLAADSLRDMRPGSQRVATVVEGKHRRVEKLALGPVRRLDVSWKGPAAQASGPPVLAADGRIEVHVEEASVTTIARLTLSSLRGPVKEWRLQVPAEAVVEVADSPADERSQAVVDAIEAVDPKTPTLRVVRLKEPTSAPVTVQVRVSQRRAEGPLPVGPFAVLGAFRQRGTILVDAPPELRVRFRPRGSISQRDPGEDQRRDPRRVVAAFHYWALPAGSTAQPAGQSFAAPLELEVEAVKGALEAEATHTIRWTARGLAATTKLSVTPLRTGADHLQVQLPFGYQFDDKVGVQAQPANVVLGLERDSPARTLTLALAKQSSPFEVTIEGFYPAPAKEDQQTALELPRPLNTLDRGGQVTVVLPEDLELVSLKAEEMSAKQQHTWVSDRIPERVEFAWRPFRADLRVDVVTDVTLAGPQAQVRQRFTFHFSKPPPAEVSLRVPDLLTDRVRLIEGGLRRPTPEPAGAELKPGSRVWPVSLTNPAGKDHSLTLEYALPLPPTALGSRDGATAVELPFVVPEEATRGSALVRVWGDALRRPYLGSGPWEIRPVEAVPERRDRFPDLVLLGTRLDVPVGLRLEEDGSASRAAASVERALIRAAVAENGYQSYRAGFLLRRLDGEDLDVELPGPLGGLGLKATLDGVPLRWDPVDERGQRAETSRTARLQISPAMLPRPAVLELSYQFIPDRSGSVALQTTLMPPLLRAEIGQVPVRWQVSLPRGWVLVYQDGAAAAEQQWGWRGWLLAPQPAVSSAELEQWLLGQEGGPSSGAPAPETNGRAGPSLVCWQGPAPSIRLVHVPQQAWLLVCSLTLLLAGLALALLPLPRPVFWAVVLLLALGWTALSFFWPGSFAAVLYGCEPGAVMLGLVLLLQWLLHRRYRQQLIFLPGFSRGKTGSSLIRATGSSNRPRGEPSTVDAPSGSGPGSKVGKGS